MTTYAFTLGVNAYKDSLIPSLVCCERDARELNGLLKERFGFDAHYLEERFTESIEERIEALSKHLKPGDVFIFYFSGHGKAHQDDHYLLLPGARLAAFESGAVVVSGVLSYRNLKHITSGHNWRDVHRLFIIDACRSHLTSKRAVGEHVSFEGEYLLKDPRRNIKRTEPGNENLTLLNSCAIGACAIELPGEGHGIFTGALLDLLRASRENGAQGELMIDKSFVMALGQSMSAKASHAGLPSKTMHQPALVGDGLALVSDIADEKAVSGGEELHWEFAKSRGTVEALEGYLRRYPAGKHREEAIKIVTSKNLLIRRLQYLAIAAIAFLLFEGGALFYKNNSTVLGGGATNADPTTIIDSPELVSKSSNHTIHDSGAFEAKNSNQKKEHPDKLLEVLIDRFENK